jgi:hypothetical protein
MFAAISGVIYNLFPIAKPTYPMARSHQKVKSIGSDNNRGIRFAR